MGAPSSRAQKRVRAKVPAATFRPGIAKLYEQRENPEDNPEAALKRWSSVGTPADATFEPHIGKVYEALEASGELRVDSITSRLRWEKINGESADKTDKKAGDDASASSASLGGAVRSLIASVQNWAKRSD